MLCRAASAALAAQRVQQQCWERLCVFQSLGLLWYFVCAVKLLLIERVSSKICIPGGQARQKRTQVLTLCFES